MPTEAKIPIPIGAPVILNANGWMIKGIKLSETTFQSNEFDTRLHDGGGRGQTGYFWFTTDRSLTPYDVVRKKTGFAKFIERTKSE